MTQEELSLGTELGDLLLRAGLLTVQDLAEVRQTAEKWNQPFEKVLLVSKRTTEVALDNALLAMKMMAEIRLSERTALEALKFASQTGMRFEDSILRVTGVGSYDTSSDLETLLVHSELVNLSSLNEGKRISVERNIPLCNSLILIGATTFTHINYLFECLYLTRHGRIAQATAINALRIVGHRNIDLATALDMQGLVSTSTLSRIKLGDLLVAGQVVSEQALVGELERAATSSCQIGEVLLNDGLVTEQVLNDTLMLQRLCISGLIDRNKAARLLRKAICTNNDLASVIRAEELFQDEDMGTEALCLLLRCKFVDTDAVLRAKKKFVPFNMGAIKALVASNLVPLEVCNAALEVALLVTTNRVSEGDAVKVLSYCRQHKCDYMTAMKKLEVEIEISDPTLEITRVQSSEKAKVSVATRLGFVLLGIFSVFVGKTFLPMEWSGLLVAAAVFFVIAGFVVSIVIQQTKEASEKEDLLFSQTETIDKLKKRRRVHI